MFNVLTCMTQPVEAETLHHMFESIALDAVVATPCAPPWSDDEWDVVDKVGPTKKSMKQCLQLAQVEVKRARKYLKDHPRTALACAAATGAAVMCTSQALLTGTFVYLCLPNINVTNHYNTATPTEKLAHNDFTS